MSVSTNRPGKASSAGSHRAIALSASLGKFSNEWNSRRFIKWTMNNWCGRVWTENVSRVWFGHHICQYHSVKTIAHAQVFNETHLLCLDQSSLRWSLTKTEPYGWLWIIEWDRVFKQIIPDWNTQFSFEFLCCYKMCLCCFFPRRCVYTSQHLVLPWNIVYCCINFLVVCIIIKFKFLFISPSD